jgi:hypothetical protein
MLIVNKNHRSEQGIRFKISQSSGTFCLGLRMCASWHGNCYHCCNVRQATGVTLMHLWDMCVPFVIRLQRIHHGKFCTQKTVKNYT